MVICGLLIIVVVSVVTNSWIPITAVICLPLIGILAATIASIFNRKNIIIITGQNLPLEHYYIQEREVYRKELN